MSEPIETSSGGAPPSGVHRLLRAEPVEHDPILELIENIQRGIRVDESSAELFKKFRPGVQSFFVRKGFSTEDSRDLTQDVFLRVFKGIDTFGREATFGRWPRVTAVALHLSESIRRRPEQRRSPIQRVY